MWRGFGNEQVDTEKGTITIFYFYLCTLHEKPIKSSATEIWSGICSVTNFKILSNNLNLKQEKYPKYYKLFGLIPFNLSQRVYLWYCQQLRINALHLADPIRIVPLQFDIANSTSVPFLETIAEVLCFELCKSSTLFLFHSYCCHQTTYSFNSNILFGICRLKERRVSVWTSPDKHWHFYAFARHSAGEARILKVQNSYQNLWHIQIRLSSH